MASEEPMASETRKVTLSDVARSLGISVSTVSRALRQSPLVDKRTATSIREEAERLGYELKPKRRQAGRAILTIAVLLPSQSDSWLHLFYDPGRLLQTLQEGFGGTRTNLLCVPDADWHDLFIHKKLGGIDGCIVAFADPPAELADRMEQASIPRITLNRVLARGNYICRDQIHAMRLHVERIRSVHGPDAKIAYLHFERIPGVSKSRYEGFLEHRSRSDIYTVSRLGDIGDELFAWLRSGGYRALICFNDVFAVYAYQAALHRGIRIPEDLALAGFDNSPVRRLTEKPIDTVELGTDEIGRKAAEWLREAIIDPAAAPMRELLESCYVPGSTIEV